jgi:hypothetical protein
MEEAESLYYLCLFFSELEQHLLLPIEYVPSIVTLKANNFTGLVEFFKFNSLSRDDELDPLIVKSQYGMFKSIYKIWVKLNIIFIFHDGTLNLPLMMKQTGLEKNDGTYAVISFFIDCRGQVVIKRVTKPMCYVAHRKRSIEALLGKCQTSFKQEVTRVSIGQKLIDYQTEILKDEMRELKEKLRKSIQQFASSPV